MHTSSYYRQRWLALVRSGKRGALTHNEWAQQNYQRFRVEHYFDRALQDERHRLNVKQQEQRRQRAQERYKEWKEAKDEARLGHRRRAQSSRANSQHLTDLTTLDDHRRHLSSANDAKHERRTASSLVFDKQRWSYRAMLERIVGLAEPLSSSSTASRP